MQYICKLLCALLMCFVLPCHAGRDAITSGGSSLAQNGTLVSAGNTFELGFFPDEHHLNWYVGIWYYNLKPRTVVWVANRDSPISDSSGVVSIKEDGNLYVLNATGAIFFSTQLDSTPSKSYVRTARLLDSGNLVVIDNATRKTLWQSFEHPADTFLPGMIMDDSLTLTSWANSSYNPTSGNYRFRKDPADDGDQYIIYKGEEIYWKSGVGEQLTSLSSMPAAVSSLLSNFTLNASILSTFHYPRLLMNSSGEIQFYSWNSSKTSWSSHWSEPDRCSVYNECGKFGYIDSCSIKDALVCKCLPGFKPTNPDEWSAEEFSGGCSKKSAISCNQNDTRDTFLNLTSMIIGNPGLPSPNAKSEKECKQDCLSSCDCKAYSYNAADPRQRGTSDFRLECRIWKSDLIGLRKDNTIGLSLSVRIAISDLELTRNCSPCSLQSIPYPLSTQPDCGDPLYYSFSCNESTGDLSFQTLNGSYPVTDINLDTQSFVIEVSVENSDRCNSRNPHDGVILLKDSSPFKVRNWCYVDDNIGHLRSQSKDSLEIGWKPQPEPTCSASVHCEEWPNSICNATEQGQGRCQCKSGFKWDALNLNCTSVMTEPGSSSERTKSSVKFRSVIISISVIVPVVILCSIGYIIYRRNLFHKRKDQENDLFTEDDKKAIDIPFFSLRIILAATENFSDANKLGQGGFGPVYKGIFPGGQEIAVKRLLSHSGQGVNEFKNEIVLIAKLQHRNLVKLLGYCITTNEKILLYEYMPNKSLDAIIFDCTLSLTLDWKMRFDIILGIARGLLYLHQDSRLRVIHRDLKASNILLDQEMNPKISDFGLARIVEGKTIEANTKKVVGTLGYMPPEYALEGLFSIKSDVFSFGVVLLEIISGRRNTSFFQSQETLNLLGHAWKFWMDEKALDMMDPILISSFNETEVLKCINIGLLCVQEDPNDRPTMSNVVIMLATENMSLPRPKQPAFVARRRLSETASSSSSSKINTLSNNELTASVVEGR